MHVQACLLLSFLDEKLNPYDVSQNKFCQDSVLNNFLINNVLIFPWPTISTYLPAMTMISYLSS